MGKNEMGRLWSEIWSSNDACRRAGTALTISLATFALSEAYWVYGLLRGMERWGFQFLFCFFVLLSALWIAILWVRIQFLNYLGLESDAEAAQKRYLGKLFHQLDKKTGYTKSSQKAEGEADEIQRLANSYFKGSKDNIKRLKRVLVVNAISLSIYVFLFELLRVHI